MMTQINRLGPKTNFDEKQRLISSKSAHKFNKQVYEDQVSFNQSVVAHLRKALDSNDAFQKEFEINEGINLIIKRNKQLMLADSYGWTMAQTYELDPITDNSYDKKHTQRAKIQAKSILEERARRRARAVALRRLNFDQAGHQGPTTHCQVDFPQMPIAHESGPAPFTYWHCKRLGHFARFCQAPIPPNPAQFGGSHRENYTQKQGYHPF